MSLKNKKRKFAVHSYDLHDEARNERYATIKAAVHRESGIMRESELKKEEANLKEAEKHKLLLKQEGCQKAFKIAETERDLKANQQECENLKRQQVVVTLKFKEIQKFYGNYGTMLGSFESLSEDEVTELGRKYQKLLERSCQLNSKILALETKIQKMKDDLVSFRQEACRIDFRYRSTKEHIEKTKKAINNLKADIERVKLMRKEEAKRQKELEKISKQALDVERKKQKRNDSIWMSRWCVASTPSNTSNEKELPIRPRKKRRIPALVSVSKLLKQSEDSIDRIQNLEKKNKELQKKKNENEEVIKSLQEQVKTMEEEQKFMEEEKKRMEKNYKKRIDLWKINYKNVLNRLNHK